MARAAKKETLLTTEEKLAKALVPEEEQPYPVPGNWCWVRIGDVTVRVKRGKAPKYVEKSDFPVFAQKCNQKDGTIALKKAQFLNPDMITKISDDDFLHNSDIVINSTGTGTLGRVGFFNEHDRLGYKKILPDSHITVVRCSSITHPYFLYLFLKGKQDYLELQGAGSTNQKELKPITISQIPIPLPPLPEQQRIVTLIESLFADLDAAKEKLQAVLDGFAQRRAALLHQAFTGELTREWREAHGLSVDDWISQTLKECCNIGSGGTPSRKNLSFYEGDIPWVKTKEIDWHEIHDTEEHISQEAIDNSSARLYNKGAVLVAMYGMGVTRGRAAILSIAAATNQAVCVLEPQKHLTNRFLFYYFMANYWTIRSKAVGGNQLNLSGTLISKFKINIPPLPEQKEIVRILDDIFAKESQSKATLESALAKIDTMKKAILATAFRGGFETNNRSDKSAKELLRKVL